MSGTRTFALTDIGGMYFFYTQGADRLTGRLDNFVGWLSDIKGNTANGVQFREGDALWEKMMAKIINEKVPSGDFNGVVPAITNRPKYDDIQRALQNGQSLSTVPCN